MSHSENKEIKLVLQFISWNHGMAHPSFLWMFSMLLKYLIFSILINFIAVLTQLSQRHCKSELTRYRMEYVHPSVNICKLEYLLDQIAEWQQIWILPDEENV